MKCPLLHHKEHNPDVFTNEVFEDCLQGECAWWDKIMGRCAVLSLVDVMTDLSERVSNLGKLVSLKVGK